MVVTGATVGYESLTGTNLDNRMALYSCVSVAQHSVIWHGICNGVIVGHDAVVQMGPRSGNFSSAKKIWEVLELMIRTFLAVVLMVVCATASADVRVLNKPVTCGNTSVVLKTLVDEFEETPQWQGENSAEGTRFLLTVNLKTGAWTLVELTSVTACVIGVGENASSRWGTPVVHTL